MTTLPTNDEIRDALAYMGAAKTEAQVYARARELGPMVERLEASPTQAVRAIHIRNLAAYRRMCIRRGWG